MTGRRPRRGGCAPRRCGASSLRVRAPGAQLLEPVTQPLDANLGGVVLLGALDRSLEEGDPVVDVPTLGSGLRTPDDHAVEVLGPAHPAAAAPGGQRLDAGDAEFAGLDVVGGEAPAAAERECDVPVAAVGPPDRDSP